MRSYWYENNFFYSFANKLFFGRKVLLFASFCQGNLVNETLDTLLHTSWRLPKQFYQADLEMYKKNVKNQVVLGMVFPRSQKRKCTKIFKHGKMISKLRCYLRLISNLCYLELSYSFISQEKIFNDTRLEIYLRFIQTYRFFFKLSWRFLYAKHHTLTYWCWIFNCCVDFQTVISRSL